MPQVVSVMLKLMFHGGVVIFTGTHLVAAMVVRRESTKMEWEFW